MSAKTGLAVLGTYSNAHSNATLATSATVIANIDALTALIPNSDSTSSSGSVAGGGFLDEMSPGAAAQLAVELAAIRALF